MRDESLHVLQHALGLDDYGRGNPYRNHYVAGEGGSTWDLLMAHVDAGRMRRHGPSDLYGGSGYCFTVTDAGREYVRTHSPQPPKRTRSQRRYRLLPKRATSPEEAGVIPAKNKYGAKRTNGYASKKEAAYAERLGFLQRVGDVRFWLEQVPVKLPGDIVYRADFLVFYRDDRVRMVEVKGFETATWKLKMKLLQKERPEIWAMLDIV